LEPRLKKPVSKARKKPSIGSQIGPASLPVSITPPSSKTLKTEWQAMGPLSKFMTMLGLFGFIVGIPGWMTAEYWGNKDPISILIPPAIAEQLNPQQVEQLTGALLSLQQGSATSNASKDQVKLALEAASRGNLKLAEGLLEEVYKDSAKDARVAQSDQANAARHLAALSIVGDAQKALTLYRQSVALDPSSREGWLGLGDAAVVAGTMPEATDAYRKFIALTPIESEAQLYAAGLDRLGDTLVAQGDIAGALQSYSSGVDISRKMAAAEPDVAEWQRNITVSLKKLSDVHIARGAYDDALIVTREATELARKLIAQTPDNRSLQRDLSVFLGASGDIHLRQREPLKAIEAYQEAYKIAARLAELAPDDAKAANDVSVFHIKIGDVEVLNNEPSRALNEYSLAFSIREKLARADPGNIAWQRDLVVNLIKIGDVKSATGAHGEASGAYEQSRLIADRLVAQDPTNTGFQRDLAVSLNKLGAAKLQLNDKIGASEAHGAGLAINQALAQRFPDNAELQRDLIISYFRMAEDGDNPAANYARALAQVQSMKAKGILQKSDEWMVDDLSNRASAAQ
jgi:tetratricopeptide (TPR) repeat protein